MSTHESYVSLETAKLLKQAGFDWECIRYYQNNEETLYGPLVEQFKLVATNFNVAPIYMDQYSAPSLSTAQRWLREVKDIDIMIRIDYHYGEDYSKAYCGTFCIDDELYTTEHFKTFEEALEAGINQLLTLLLKEK